MLSNHNFDTTRMQKQQKPNCQQYKQQEDGESKNDESPTLSSAQLEGKCYCLGKPGHKSPEFRQKEKIPHDEWAINKAQSNAQAKNDDNSIATGTTTNRSTQSVEKTDAHIGWAWNSLFLCPRSHIKGPHPSGQRLICQTYQASQINIGVGNEWRTTSLQSNL